MAPRIPPYVGGGAVNPIRREREPEVDPIHQCSGVHPGVRPVEVSGWWLGTIERFSQPIELLVQLKITVRQPAQSANCGNCKLEWSLGFRLESLLRPKFRGRENRSVHCRQIASRFNKNLGN